MMEGSTALLAAAFAVEVDSVGTLDFMALLVFSKAQFLNNMQTVATTDADGCWMWSIRDTSSNQTNVAMIDNGVHYNGQST